MHLMIVNGSPRVKKFSNTDKIIAAFTKGYCEDGDTCELYTISDRTEWDAARAAFEKNTEVLIATPLYTENIQGLLLEFLETLPVKEKAGTRISFLLQGGFAEGCQLRCGEAFLEKLPSYLGCAYGGTLVKGDNFGIRVAESDDLAKLLKPYEDMGRLFSREHGFDNERARAFTGTERFSLPARLALSVLFKAVAPKRFEAEAKKWGCTQQLDARPYAPPREG